MFGTLNPVNETTALLRPDDARRIIAALTEDLQPCSKSQATTLVAELVSAYPGLTQVNRNEAERAQFAAYTIKLFEAFSRFSYAIGKAIVHGGAGVPARVNYRPQPSDIVTFGEREELRRQDAKTMAQRHLREADKRERQRADDAILEKSRGSAEQRRRQVETLLAGFKATA
jgi:hypothetical protein